MKRVLLVEDDDDDAFLVGRLFNKLYPKGEVQLERVSHGREALDRLIDDQGRLRSPVPDLILLDLRMPVLDGFDVLDRMKSAHQTRPAPIVVMTTSTSDVDRARAYGIGANAYMVKPLVPNTFREAITAATAFWLKHNVLPAVCNR